jgi:hypothetical protein
MRSITVYLISDPESALRQPTQADYNPSRKVGRISQKTDVRSEPYDLKLSKFFDR